MHIRVDDTVKVISGEDKGTEARVLKVQREDGRIIVEGVNRVYRHVRRSQKNPQGGRLSKEMPVDASNLMLVCPLCGKASRTGVRISDSGQKELLCKKCKGTVRVLSNKTAKARN